MRAHDTSEKAAAIQESLHRAMGPEGRLRLAMRMSDLTHEFAKAGVREKHPDYGEVDVLRELTRILYGR
jgi:hypothetical protein